MQILRTYSRPTEWKPLPSSLYFNKPSRFLSFKLKSESHFPEEFMGTLRSSFESQWATIIQDCSKGASLNFDPTAPSNSLRSPGSMECVLPKPSLLGSDPGLDKISTLAVRCKSYDAQMKGYSFTSSTDMFEHLLSPSHISESRIL